MLTLLANAKINLYLEIVGSRPDGFHELVMVMQSVALCD
ncbi:MAG: 4-(cytidine 5'-diphospho)-2-C-methyl-D-erythritol kinase, partial [Cyanobacteria bacterium P01_D01_bin.36]